MEAYAAEPENQAQESPALWIYANLVCTTIPHYGDFHNEAQNGNTSAPTGRRSSLLGRSGKRNLKGVA